MSTLWKTILEDGKGHPSNIIKEEILNLTNNGKELETGLVELEATLQGLQKDLLAGKKGAFEAVRETEASISEHRNKIAAIKSVIKDLEKKVAEAVANEQATRRAEIKQEIAAIDAKVLELRKEALSYFSKAAVIVNKLHGNERVDLNLGYDYFLRCNLSTELHRQIAAGGAGQEGPSLYTRREQLQRESV